MKHKDWAWKPLRELFEFESGKTMSASARKGTSMTPFLRTSNVLWDEIDLSKLDEMSFSPTELIKKNLKPGDLLVCEGGEIGRAAVWSGELSTISFQNHIHRLRPKTSDIDPRFYVFFLQSAFTQLGLFEGAGNKTTIPNLSRNCLASLDFPHPPLNEQRTISKALAQIRMGINTNLSIVKTSNELKIAIMRTLFTRGLQSEDQKETEFGLVPISWNVDTIGNHYSITSGGTPSRNKPEYWNGGMIPWVKSTDINYSKIWNTSEYITKSGLASSSAKLLSQGAILMAMYGQGVTRGRVAILEIEAACNQACAAMYSLTKTVDQKFLFYFLTYHYENIRRLAHGGQQQNLNLEIIRNLPLAFPENLDQQLEIVSILEAIDQKIDIHKKKQSILEDLFKSLLYKFMTGEIRVDALDLSVFERPVDAIGTSV